MRYVAFVCRQLFSILFIVASASHFDPQTIAVASRHGGSAAGVLMGVMALQVNSACLWGFQARFGAALLAVFLIPVRFSCTTFGLRSIQPWCS